jgi:outer membrane cobalamin receptor
VTSAVSWALAVGAVLAGIPASGYGAELLPPPDASAAVPPAASSETVVVGRRDGDAPREDRTGAASVVRPGESPRAFDDLGTILLEVPGVTASRTGSIGAFSTISIRGSSPDEVRVYLDGVPLNLASGGAVDISTLPVGDVERVEVYRGASPLAYGQSALGGIVAITTLTPVDTSLKLRSGMGSFGSRFGDLTGGGQLGRVRLYAGVHGYRATGDYRYHNDNGTPANPDDDVVDMPRQNNDLAEVNGVVRAVLPLPGRRTLQAGGIGFARERGLTGRGTYPTLKARLVTTRALGYLRYQSRDDLGSGGALAAQLYLFDQRDRTRDLEGELGVGGPRLTYNISRALGGIVNGSRPLAGWLRAAGILEGRRETYTPENQLDDSPTGLPGRRLTAVAGTELDFLWAWADLNIVPSARVEIVSDRVTHGAAADPVLTRQLPILRLGLVRALGPHAALKGNLGRYARIPSFLELYGDGTGRLLGNPDLLPERGINADLELWIDTSRVTSRTGLFAARVDQLIRWQSASWGQARAGNLAEARVWGAEQEVRIALGRHVRTIAQATYLRAVDESDNPGTHGRQLPFRPRVSGYLRPELVHVPLPAALELAAYADADVRGQTYGDSGNLLLLGPRLLVGAGLTVAAPRAGLRLTASAANLTDDRRGDFVDWALPGRTLFVTLAYAPVGLGPESATSPIFDPRHGP